MQLQKMDSGQRERVRVAVRVRPLNNYEISLSAASVVGATGKSITLVDPIALEVAAVHGNGRDSLSLDLPRRTFTFDFVYHGRGLEIAGDSGDGGVADGLSSQQSRVTRTWVHAYWITSGGAGMPQC